MEATGESRHPWIVLSLVLAAQVAISLVAQGVPTLSVFLQQDYGLSLGEVGLFGAALTTGTVVTLMVAGWAVDTRGERLVLILGNTLVGVAVLGMIVSNGMVPALVCLAFVGAGAAVPTPAGTRAIMLAFPLAKRGFAMGLRQTGIPLGGTLAALLLPPLALAFGWRVALGASGVISLVAAAACWYWFQEPSSAPCRAAAAGDRRTPSRSASWKDVLTRDIGLMSAAGAFLPAGQFCLVTYLVLFLSETRELSVGVGASLLVVAQLAGALGRVALGWASDNLFGGNRKLPLLLASLGGAVGAAIIAWLPLQTPLWTMGLIVGLMGFCTIGWQGNWVALLAEMAAPAAQGRTLGTAMTSTYTGITLLPPLFGALVDRTGSWPMGWLALALVLLVGGGLVALVREPAKR